jgi:hypothetical protein
VNGKAQAAAGIDALSIYDECVEALAEVLKGATA